MALSLIVAHRSDEQALLPYGIDLQQLMRDRPEAWALFAVEPSGLSIAFADDISTAADIILTMCRYAPAAPDTLEAPESIRAVLRAHACGNH